MSERHSDPPLREPPRHRRRGCLASGGRRRRHHRGGAVRRRPDRPVLHARRLVPAGRRPLRPSRAGFAAEVERFGLDWSLRAAARPRRVLILVVDVRSLPGRPALPARLGELNMDVVGIVSNHPRRTLPQSESGDIPYHHLPVTATPSRRRRRNLRLVEESGPNWSCWRATCRSCPTTCRVALGALHQHPPLVPARLQGREALPSGPCARGEDDRRDGALRDGDLDEGPIIDQDVERVTMPTRPTISSRRAATSSGGCWRGPSLAPRGPGAFQRPQTVVFRK